MLREGVWLKISLWLSFPKRGPDGTPASPAVKSGETSNRAVVPGRFIPMAGDLAHGDQLPGMGAGAPPTDLVFIHFGASRTRSRVKPTTSRARRQVNPFCASVPCGSGARLAADGQSPGPGRSHASR